jgi:alanine racemase
MTGTAPYRTWVEVSLSRLRQNYFSIAGTLPEGTQMMPVVKANAYGHGALPVARTLVSAGCRWLAVSSSAEGTELRAGGIGPEVRILVMAGICDFEWPLILDANLTPVLHSLEDLAIYNQLASDRQPTGSAPEPLPFHFKLDTGLARLGSREDLSTLIEAFRTASHCRLEGIMTHFASAANLKSPMTGEQTGAFEGVVAAIRDAGVGPFLQHVDATNSLHLARHTTPVHLVRPGHAIYGYVTQPGGRYATGRLKVRPALSWKARVILVKSVPADTSVGYGGLFRTTRPTKLAVIAVGYSDGYPHQLSNRGSVLTNGQFAPIVGAISMDVSTIDVTDVPEVKAGQTVTLLGADGDQEINAIHLGRQAKTISYSILCNINYLLPRIYDEQD